MRYPAIWLCLDSADFSGAYYLLGEESEAHVFATLAEFLRSMEETLTGNEACPSAARSGGRPWTGKAATFHLQPLYHQHSTWQGVVRWVEGDEERRYRSALELILLIEDMLSDQSAERGKAARGQ